MSTTQERYAEIRAKYPGISARNAYMHATADRPVPERFSDALALGEDGAEWEHGGFDIRLEIDVDQFADNSWLGTWSAHWQDGAVKHWRGDRNSYDWFIPGVDYATHWRALRKTHSRHDAHTLARSYVLRDYERAATCGDDWAPLVYTVSASRNGIELGSMSCGGIESDAGDDHKAEILADLELEAIEQAKSALRKLCAS